VAVVIDGGRHELCHEQTSIKGARRTRETVWSGCGTHERSKGGRRRILSLLKRPSSRQKDKYIAFCGPTKRTRMTPQSGRPRRGLVSKQTTSLAGGESAAGSIEALPRGFEAAL
jgi:hypothetical protein